MNNPHDYWLSPTGEMVPAKPDHHRKAIAILSSMGREAFRDSPTEDLLRFGWVRVVACIEVANLFFERRAVPTEKQMASMRNLAIETRCRLDDGRHIIFDPEEP